MGLFLFLACFPATSIANYNLNFSDTSSYHITCGKVTSWWSVKLDSCMLSTTYMRTESDSSILTCDFRLNQSGNLDLEDNAYIQYQINDEGWVTDTSITGFGLDAVWFRSFPLTLYYGDYIQFRVIFETNDQTEFWALENDGISITGDFTIYSTLPGDLPVEFTSINCITGINLVILNWATASETNNDYFTIERSENGIDFYAIGYTDGAGNSNDVLEYVYKDNEPIIGESYYRIRQVDFDGQYSLSEVVSTNYQNSTEEMTVHSENGLVTVNITSGNETNVTLTLIDITGRNVIREHFTLNEGSNILTSSTRNIPEGIYIVHFAKSDGSSIVKKCFIN